RPSWRGCSGAGWTSSSARRSSQDFGRRSSEKPCMPRDFRVHLEDILGAIGKIDRKSTRLNSSHVSISYAVFCLKKKSLTYHKLSNKLVCHYSGTTYPPLTTCAACGSYNFMQRNFCTETIEEQLVEEFPTFTIAL